MYLNTSIDQLKKNNPKHFRVILKFWKDTEIHYILRRYNMVCYPLHVLTQFLNLSSYIKNLTLDEIMLTFIMTYVFKGFITAKFES